MKKYLNIIIIMCIACLFVACYTSEDEKRLQSNCEALQNRKTYLSMQITSLKDNISSLQKETEDLLKERNALKKGREPRYIVKFKIKQGTFTLDPFEHIKNSMNAIEVEIPVAKDFYKKLEIGQDITDAFKWGSLVMNGDFSELHMKVISKRIE